MRWPAVVEGDHFFHHTVSLFTIHFYCVREEIDDKSVWLQVSSRHLSSGPMATAVLAQLKWDKYTCGPSFFCVRDYKKKTKMIINRRPHVATANTEGPYEIHSNSFIVIDFCSLCFCNGMPSFIERISIQANQWQLFIIFSKTLRPCGSLVITSIRGRKHNQSTSIWRQKKNNICRNCCHYAHIVIEWDKPSGIESVPVGLPIEPTTMAN